MRAKKMKKAASGAKGAGTAFSGERGVTAADAGSAKMPMKGKMAMMKKKKKK